jgi:hypothetical protein
MNREGIARARAARLARKAEFEAELESALHQLSQSQQRVRNADAMRRQLLDQVVPLVDAQVTDANAMAGAGEFDALRQLDTLTRRHDTRVRVLEATLKHVRAQDAVLVLLGPAFKEEAK